MSILVLGRSGQLARELARLDPALRLAGREAIDLERPETVAAAIRERRPRAVINAAAYTAVDKAESERDRAFAVNAVSVGEAAQACAALGAPFVQVSTDYVFDGTKAAPYLEDDPVAPLNVYGESKAAGERAALAAGPAVAVVRTAWVVSPHGANFVKTMLRLAGEREEIAVVADQIGAPTHAADLARACHVLARKLLAADPAARGVFHFTGAGEASWADVAEAVFAASSARGGPSARVRRITTAEYPTPARRPANSRLASGRIAALGLTPAPWRERVEACVAGVVNG